MKRDVDVHLNEKQRGSLELGQSSESKYRLGFYLIQERGS
jgi:hypothetical protein